MNHPHNSTTAKPLVTVQGEWLDRRRGSRVELSEKIVMMAEAEYERRYSQTIDRLRERGGLGLGEVIMLLADAVERYAPEGKLVPKSLTIKNP